MAKLEQWDPVLGAHKSQKLRDADKFISNAGKLMTQMLEIAEAAKDKTLEDSERMALQIELGRLQHELNHITENVAGDNRVTGPCRFQARI
jgi:flagellin-like hook-associated protein FlgL